jgi:carboxypeptidase T
VIDPDLDQTFYSALQASGDPSPLGAYTSCAELTQRLLELHAAYPQIIGQPISIGKSLEGRDIWAVKLSDHPEVEAPKPEALYIGGVHSRELIGVEIPLGFLERLAAGYGHDPALTDLVDNTQLWFVPMLNPDGHVWVEQGNALWRKNRRGPVPGAEPEVVFGVDLNRNYGTDWGYDNQGSSPVRNDLTYRGPAPFSEPETAAIRDFVQAHRFRYAIDFHSGAGRCYLYPWGHRRLSGVDEETFRTIGRLMARGNGYQVGTPLQTVGSVSNGASDDWLYAGQESGWKTFAFGAEVTGQFAPSDNQIAKLVAENMPAATLLAQLTRASGLVEILVDSDASTVRVGDTWGGRLLLVNRTSQPQRVTVWTSMEDPSYRPLPPDPSQAATTSLVLPPSVESAAVVPFRVPLPASTPPGSYRFNATVGLDYPYPVVSAMRARLTVVP